MKSSHMRTLRPPQILGAVLLLIVILTVVCVQVIPGPDDPELTQVIGYGGGLKGKFFADPEIKKILADKYGLEVTLIEEGSIQLMCDAGVEDKDFLWVGDQSSVGIYTSQCNGTMIRQDNIYDSPIVFYSWTAIVDALVTAGVAQNNNGVYSVDTAALIAMVENGTTWASIGLPAYGGPVSIHSTDPAKSNSGFLYSGLTANVMNGNVVVTTQTVVPLLPRIAAFFQLQGYMTEKSADFFDQFLMRGPGSYPIAVAYESQLIEYLTQNPNQLTQVNADVRMLYPNPTVWASNPLIARTEAGSRLLDALKDSNIQRLAWEHHGNRPSVPGVPTSTPPVAYTGLTPSVASIFAANMPREDVMRMIIEAIATPQQMPAASPTASGGGSIARAGTIVKWERGSTRALFVEFEEDDG